MSNIENFRSLFELNIYEDTTIKVESGYDEALTISVDGADAVALPAYGGTPVNTAVNVSTETTLVITGLPVFSGLIINNVNLTYNVETLEGSKAHFTAPSTSADMIFFANPKNNTLTVKVSGACIIRGLA